jgi:hypothetical protein
MDAMDYFEVSLRTQILNTFIKKCLGSTDATNRKKSYSAVLVSINGNYCYYFKIVIEII